MNIIKYLRWKTVCPICSGKLYKDMDNEIYCLKCGLLVLDFYPVTPARIDNAMEMGHRQWVKRKKKKNKF